MQPSGVDDTGTTHQVFLRMEDEVVVDDRTEDDPIDYDDHSPEI